MNRIVLDRMVMINCVYNIPEIDIQKNYYKLLPAMDLLHPKYNDLDKSIVCMDYLTKYYKDQKVNL